MENILFKVPEPSEYSKVLEAFEKYFIKHEPGLTSLGGYPDGLPPKILERYRRFLEEGVSVIAIDNTNDLICGTMVSVMLTRENESMTPKPTFEDLKERLNDKHAKINVLCNDTFHPSNFFESFKDYNKCLDLFAIGVHEKYQRKGIASKLVLESIKAGFAKGCDSAVIIATNPNTNGIAKKLNFSHYKSVYWSDYKDTKTGEDWFPADKLPYTIVNSYYKLLKDRTEFM